MKNTRRLLAVLLVLAMVFSCLPLSVFAASKNASVNAAAASQKAQLGFKSMSFRESNTYRYQADELVRAIVVMDGEPAGAVTGNRASIRAKLAAQHDTLRKGMKNISYTELFEYDSLLNGLAVETAYGNLDAIAAMSGVKAVYIANRYELPVYDVKMESSNEMTGLAIAHNYGLGGSGMVIAILDTGMTAGHDAFAVYEGMLSEAALSEEDAAAFIAGKGYGAYVSQKIPFSYDYADVDDNAEDSTNGHGPHVSGIAAGYAEDPDGAITFMGAAPDAQLLEMKIFNDESSGTSSDIYFAALEDAFELGADVINMSIGAQNGFTYDSELENDVYGNMYQILEDNGVVCCISAGNEGSMAANASNWAGAGYATADYADYGVLGSPSTYDGNMSIASLENAEYPAYVLKCGDLEIPYYDSDENNQFFKAMCGKELNFVDCGFGNTADFEGKDVKGKIALISRGDITFQEKVDNAAAAGAAAAIVYNNADGVIYMAIDPYAIPAASITKADGEALLALLAGGEEDDTKCLRATDKVAKRDVETMTGKYVAEPEDGAPVALYSAADGVIMAYSAEYADDGTYLTAWNQKTEEATLDGDTVTFDWEDAGILYACAQDDGTWAFVDQYEYDSNEETYLLYNDGTYVGTVGETSDGDYVCYNLIASGDGYKFQNVGSELYLVIEDGLFYDTDDASKATVLSFYDVSEDGGDDDDDPPVVSGADYKLASEVKEGNYLVVNADASMAMSNGTVTGGGKTYRAGEAVTPADGVITTDNADLVWKFEATEGGYYIKNAEGKTLSCTSGLDYADDNNVWTFEKNDDGTFYIVSTTAKGTSGDPKTIEWYSNYSEFSVYYVNDTNGSLFAMNLYAEDNHLDTDAPIITFPEEKATVANPEAWLMSDYSSWGCTPSLTLKPYITGIGGDVNSVALNSTDDYVIYSGTSMSAPNVSGFMAVLLSELMNFAPDMSKTDRAAMAEALAESTAMVLTDADGYPYSPRKQGAGLINAVYALCTGAYIVDPIQNLYDNTDGVYEFTFTVKNFGTGDESYTVDPYVLYDYLTYGNMGTDDEPDYHFYNTLTSDILDDADYTVEAPEKVTVAAGETAEVTVKITLTDETKAFFDEYYPNGNFVEGYVILTSEDDESADIHATYMGFYGDWTKAPIMEQHDWREIVDAETWLNTTAADEDGNTYADYGYTYLDAVDFEVNTDINITYALNYYYLTQGKLYGGYAGDNLFSYENFNENHIAISEGENGICDTLYMMPMNLRNCRHMIMVVTNAETGEVYYVDDTEYLPKAVYDDDYGYWANTGSFIWDGTDADGNAVDSDTVVDITYYCNLAYGEDTLGAIDYADLKTEGTDYVEWAFQCTVDNDAPEFTYEYDEATETLTVTATDNQYVAYIGVYAGEEEIASMGFSEDEAGKTVTATFEGVPNNAVYEIDVADYATNIVADNAVIGDVPTATVTFAFPASCELDGMEVTTEVPVGTSITLPTLYGDADGGYFALWITSELEGVISDEDLYEEEYDYLWEQMYLDGDEFTVTEDITFYALFERVTGYYEANEELALCTADQADWSGTWAFNGYDWSSEDVTDYLLSSDLSTFTVDPDAEDEYIAYGFFGDGYLYGAIDEHLFEIEMTGVDEDGYGIYTIKTADGKYIAINEDGELILVDEASDAYATWDIWFDTDSGCNIVWNRGAEYVLMFDEATKTIDSVSVEVATVDSPNNLYMFGPSASGYEYYTKAEPIVEKDPCEGYIDIDRSSWYHTAADFVILNGYMGSTSTTELTFEPTTKVSRAMVASIMYRIAGAPAVEYKASFTDVPEGKWFTTAIEWAAQNGLAAGKGEGKFDPNGNVTRQELAVFMYKLADFLGQDVSGKADLSSFPDADKVPSWAKSYVEWAVNAGLISGKANGGKTYLAPVDTATRAEFASIIMRFLSDPA